MYETRVEAKTSKQVVVSVIFSNLTSSQVKSLDFNVRDTLNTRLIRGVSIGILVVGVSIKTMIFYIYTTLKTTFLSAGTVFILPARYAEVDFEI